MTAGEGLVVRCVGRLLSFAKAREVKKTPAVLVELKNCIKANLPGLVIPTTPDERYVELYLFVVSRVEQKIKMSLNSSQNRTTSDRSNTKSRIKVRENKITRKTKNMTNGPPIQADSVLTGTLLLYVLVYIRTRPNIKGAPGVRHARSLAWRRIVKRWKSPHQYDTAEAYIAAVRCTAV